MIESLGIPSDRITLTPYAVDNDWWKAQAARVDRTAVRAQWGSAPDQPVILFCAKLQPWKRPLDLLRAFQRAALGDALLVFAGEGSQRKELEREAAQLKIQDRVKFLGFVNQSQLPALYTGADVLVLPSDYEPFAVVVNEAMCCGCPAIVSDKVGAGPDLVLPVRPEFVFPVGNIARLAATLQLAFADRRELRETARRAGLHVEQHAPQVTIVRTMEAVSKAVARVRLRRKATP
jgi:glycosyltransferase involved in cell wall biosynthesis